MAEETREYQPPEASLGGQPYDAADPRTYDLWSMGVRLHAHLTRMPYARALDSPSPMPSPSTRMPSPSPSPCLHPLLSPAFRVLLDQVLLLELLLATPHVLPLSPRADATLRLRFPNQPPEVFERL